MFPGVQRAESYGGGAWGGALHIAFGGVRGAVAPPRNTGSGGQQPPDPRGVPRNGSPLQHRPPGRVSFGALVFLLGSKTDIDYEWGVRIDERVIGDLISEIFFYGIHW